MAKKQRRKKKKKQSGDPTVGAVENQSAEDGSKSQPPPKSDATTGSRGNDYREQFGPPDRVMRVNQRFLIAFLVVVVGVGAGVHWLHSSRFDRSLSDVYARGLQAAERGDSKQALKLLAQYVALKPDDTQALAEYGLLLNRTTNSSETWSRIYETFEQVLRQDPFVANAVAIRYQLIEAAIYGRRYRDALVHLRVLRKSKAEGNWPDSTGDASPTSALPDDAELCALQGRCHAGEGRYLVAAQYLLAAIQQKPTSVSYYVQLASLLSEHADQLPNQARLRPVDNLESMHGFEFDEEWLELFPVDEEIDAGDRETLARDVSGKVLERMVRNGEPKQDAYLARAANALAEQDFDRAGNDVEAALAQAGDDASVLLAAARLELARSERAITTGHREQAQEFLDSAAGHIKKGRAKGSKEIQFDFVRQQLDLQQLRIDPQRLESPSDYARPIEIIRAAIDKLPAAYEANSTLTDKKTREREFYELRALDGELQFTLVDLLISQAENSPDEKKQELLGDLRKPTSGKRTPADLIARMRRPGVADGRTEFLVCRLLVARLGISNQASRPGENWRGAVFRLEATRPLLVGNSTLNRRLDLMLGQSYAQLNNPDARVTVFRRALGDDPDWIRGRLELAQVLTTQSQFAKAIEECALLWSSHKVSSVPAAIAGIRIREQLARPAAQRDWEAAELALTAAQEDESNRLHNKLLTVELRALQQQFAAANTVITEAFAACKDDDERAVVWATSARLALSRSDVAQANRVRNAETILQEAIAEVGDHVQLRLAGVTAALQQSPGAARKSLQQFERELEKDRLSEPPLFSEEDRITLLKSFAVGYLQIKELDAEGNESEERREWRLNKARELWNEVAKLRPRDLSTRLVQIELANQDKNDDEVRGLLSQIRNIEGPDGPLGNYVEAALLVRQAALAHDDDVETTRKEADNKKGRAAYDYKKAQMTKRGERLKSALEKPRSLLRSAAAKRRSWSAVSARQGDLEALARNEDLAVTHYRRAVEFGERSARITTYVMRVLDSQERFAEAKQFFEEATKEAPQLVTPEVAGVASRVAFRLNEIDRAGDLARRAVSEREQYQQLIVEGHLKYRKYEDLQERKQIDEAKKVRAEARAAYTKATELAAEKPETWLAYIVFLVRVEDLEAAVNVVETLDEKLPDDPPHLRSLTRAIGYELVGQLSKTDEDDEKFQEQATAAYRAALKTSPDDVPLRIRVADYFNRTGQFKESLAELDRIQDPELKASPLALSWAERRHALLSATSGTYEDATRALRRLEKQEFASEAEQLLNLKARAQILVRRRTRRDRLALIDVLEQIDALQPLSPEGRFQLVRLHERVGDWEQALPLLRKLGDDNPSNVQFKAYLVHGLIAQNRHEEAQAEIEGLESALADSLALVTLKALLLNAQGDPEGGARLIESHLESLESVASSEDAVRKLFTKKTPEETVAWLAERAKAEGNRQAVGILQRCQELVKSGDIAAAQALLTESFRGGSLKTFLHQSKFVMSAKLLASFRQFAAAERVYRKGMTFSSQPDDIFPLIAYVTKQQRIDDALDLCEQAWKAATPGAAANSSVAVIRAGTATAAQIKRVDDWLQAAIEDNADDAQLLVHLADLRDYEGRYDDAEQIYRRTLSLDGTRLWALNNLAWLSGLRGKNAKEGLQFVNKAIERAGALGELLDTRAIVHLALGDPESAIRDLSRAVEASPSPTKYYHLATAQLQAGQSDAARESYRTALDAGFTAALLHPLERKLHRQFAPQLNESDR